MMGCHIIKGQLKKSSRVLNQSQIDGFDVYQKNKLIELRLLFAKPKHQIYIFHQHAMLCNLILFYLIHVLFSRRKVKIIFDIHDLNELKVNRILLSKLFWCIHELNEKIAFNLPIGYMTVSKGLSRILYRKNGKNVFILSNICQPFCNGDYNSSKLDKLVYFGQVNEERLPIDYIKKLVDKGYQIDLFGTLDSAGKVYLGYINENANVEFKGEFDAGDIQKIISVYKFSLLCICSKRSNIRFCCPNKLYQSLSAGIPCVISNCLKEVMIRFNKKFVVDFESFLLGNVDVSVSPQDYLDIYKECSEQYLKFLSDFK